MVFCGWFLGIVMTAGSLLAQDAGVPVAPVAPGEEAPASKQEARAGGYAVPRFGM